VSHEPDADPPELVALSAWAPDELAKTFVALSGDVALVVDPAGLIRSVAQAGADQIVPDVQGWVGRRWADTVSEDSRAKIEALLAEVAASGIGRRREVNHPIAAGATVPVAYAAIRLGAGGPALAVGHDLRAIAAIQQRYLESQQALERGYWRTRKAEARLRWLLGPRPKRPPKA
jgi:hypothetical protein